MTTEIKKALQIQNSILKKENEMLKKQEEGLDILLKSKPKGSDWLIPEEFIESIY